MIDIQSLLEPLGTESPTGADLRAAGDATLSRIRELRREEDELSSVDGRPKSADWHGVARDCETALRERSKHLDLVRYLTEALVHTEGFAGLRTGLALTREMLARFWDQVHPGFEAGKIDLEIRAAPITWLGSAPEFLVAVKQIPMLGGDGTPSRSWFDYEESQRVDEASRRVDRGTFEELRAAGKLTGEEWSKQLGAAPRPRLRAVLDDIESVRRELEALKDLCHEKFGDESPSLTKLQALLEQNSEYLQPFLAEAANPGPVTAHPTTAPAIGHFGPIQSREQAYERLREAAAYLRRIEPHSPVPLLVERAIQWGSLPFEGVFKDVVKSADVLQQVWQTLGLPEEHKSD